MVGRMSEKKPVANIDADIRNADWIKTLCWDLPTDEDEFLGVLGVAEASTEQQREAAARFMTLPAAEPIPADVRDELVARGLLEVPH